MAFGFGPSIAQMGVDNRIMGASPPPQKRQITLDPYSYNINGTSVANSDWHPEAGETVTMIGPDDKGYLTKTLGTYRYMGEPPGSGLPPEARGLPGLIANLFNSLGGKK